MKTSCTAAILTISAILFAVRPASANTEDLRWTTYLTAHSVRDFFQDSEDGANHVARLHELRITKAILEVYRGGLVIEQPQLERVRDYLRDHGFEVWAGIATVPGGDFGVRQEGPLGWFNWQNEKTQDDLRQVAVMSAKVFDTFIVDDFLCTGDVSAESQAAKGNRSWGEYRRDLLTRLAREIFIDPMRAENPAITLVIKYPQWYDRFHLFGYDVPQKSAQFDLTWVGTETRGATTQRFGFVQPYEGFVNYRWIRSIAGDKTAGAWFDHGDCDEHDFIEQAYQTVLAGAPDIVLFSHAQLVQGHPGHDLLIQEQDRLHQLSEFVRQHPVHGIPAYKPPNSDPAGDMYLFDFLGMIGIPLIPVAELPNSAPVVFIPAQAAHDPNITGKILALANNGTRVIMTASFLATVQDGDALAQRAGLVAPVTIQPFRAQGTAWIGNFTDWRLDPPIHEDMSISNAFLTTAPIPERGLDIEAPLVRDTAHNLILVSRGPNTDDANPNEAFSFLTAHAAAGTQFVVLNTHTYSQADFDAVGEVLLAPRQLGLLDVSREFANQLREPFNDVLNVSLDAPPRVTLQPMGQNDWFIQNYQDEPVTVRINVKTPGPHNFLNVFTGQAIAARGPAELTLHPRSRFWLRLLPHDPTP